MGKLLGTMVAFCCCTSLACAAAPTPQKQGNAPLAPRDKGAEIKATAPDSDADLEGKGYPEDYVKRVKGFRKMIRDEQTREAKIKKAIALLKDKNSPYRQDAVVFLAAVKAEGVLDDFYQAARSDSTLHAHVAAGYGSLGDPHAIPYLINLLSSSNVNAQDAAAKSLVKLSGQNFGFDSDDSEARKAEIRAKYKEWWKGNKESLLKKRPPDLEKDQEAEEKWQVYGRPYLEKPAASQ